MKEQDTKLESLVKAGDELATFAKSIAETHGWEYTKAIAKWEAAREEIKPLLEWEGSVIV